MFFPGQLRAARKKRLTPVLDQEITDIKSRYLLSDDDEVNKKQMNREIKAVHKKYRVSAGSGCLSALLQLPIYIALYNVVRSPNLFVPAIQQLYADPDGNAEIISSIQKLFGWSIDISPLLLGWSAFIFPLLICLLTIYGNRKAFSQQKFSGPKKNFFKWYTRALLALQTVLLTCFSFKFPLGISIYWLTNDVMNIILDYAADLLTGKNKGVQKILDAYHAKRSHGAAGEETGEESEKELLDAGRDEDGTCLEPVETNSVDSASAVNSQEETAC